MSIKSNVRKALAKVASDLDRGSYDNEEQVIQSAIMCILNALGWDIYAPEAVKKEYPVDEKKVDIALRNNGRALVFIEAKAVGKITDDSVKQAFTYASYEAVPLLVLTDGREWNFYLPLAPGKRPDRQFYKLLISKEDHVLDKCLEVFCAYLSREEVVSERAREKADNILQERKMGNDQKKKEVILKSMSQAWKTMLEESSDLRSLLAEETNRECEHSPSNDMIEEFLSVQVHRSDVVSDASSAKPAKESNVATPINNLPHDQIRSNDPFLNSRIRITGVSFKGEEHRLGSGIRVLVLALELFSKEDSSFLERFKQASMTSRGIARVSKDPDELFPESYNDDNAGRCEQLAIPGGWWVYIGLSKPHCRALLITACKVMEVTYGEEFKVLT